jgi:hypothetical protein
MVQVPEAAHQTFDGTSLGEGEKMAPLRFLVPAALLLCITMPRAANNNTLTAEEAAAGYELLWNGKDFTGWRLNNDRVNPGDPALAANWAIVTTKGVESGDTHKSADPDSNVIEVASSGYSVYTSDTSFRDFDLKFEWQTMTDISSNSGVRYYFEPGTSTEPNASSVQYQLINSKWTVEWTSLLNTAGTLYDLFPLRPSQANADRSPAWCRPDGEWNQSRIVSFNTRAAHYGNGLRLLEYDKASKAWKNAINVSLLKSWPRVSLVHAGSIYLEDHGQKGFKFRNLRVKRLTEDPWGKASPYLNRDSAATGDTILIDTLEFKQNLFPSASAVRPGARDARMSVAGRARDLLGRAGKAGRKAARIYVNTGKEAQ